jgi:CSLREA domain-containing protein
VTLGVSTRTGGSVGAWALGLLLLACVQAGPAAAFDVTTTDDQFGEDSGHCGLREAVQAVNIDGAFGGCTPILHDLNIKLAAGPVYTLTRNTLDGTPDDNAEGDIDIHNYMAISGESFAHTPALRRTPIVMGDGDRVFDVSNGTLIDVSFQAMTISAGASSSGGGMAVSGAASTRLFDVTMSDNSASGFGGAIANTGDLQLYNTTLAHNTAGGDGGAVHTGGTVTGYGDTIAGNTADSDSNGTGMGGGVMAFNAGTFTARNVIVADNHSGAAGGPDCAEAGAPGGQIISGGAVLLGSTLDCAYAPAAKDVVNQSPLLGPLTALDPAAVFTPEHYEQVFNLLAGSPARDAGVLPDGPLPFPVDDDQHRAPRVLGLPDIGAIESPVPAGDGGSTPSGGSPAHARCRKKKKHRRLARIAKKKKKCRKKKRRR